MADNVELETEEPKAKKSRQAGPEEGLNVENDSPQKSSEEKVTDKFLTKGNPDNQSVVEDAVPKTENDVGMTEYLSSHDGFSGIIKQRYSDFLVNEVSESGEIVKLSNIDTPIIDDETEVKPSAKLLETMTEDQIQQLRDIEKTNEGELWIEVGEDKEKRTNIHSVIRENFTDLESSTTDKDSKKYIKVCSGNTRHNFNKHTRVHHKRKPAWPRGKPDYCQFVLYKENNDTPNAINQIAKVLRMNAGQFTYAGTKDKRAKSCQLISVYRVTATRLHHLNKRFKYFALGNFKYTEKPLKLGMLKGNHFTIILRNVTGTDEQINQGVNTLKQLGFINYFGMQRFGTSVVPTNDIGRAILQNKWSEVVELIMQPRNDGISKARNVWKETQDANAALQALGYNPCIEKHLLTGLSKCMKNDIVGALSYIPRNSRHLYLHSYQSYIWNQIVSIRIKKYGLKPMVGDLVLPSKSCNLELEDARVKPEYLSEANVGNYTIHDIVLPLPGFDVILPDNDIAKEYHQLLKEDLLELDSFKHKVKDYAMPGGYRNLLVKPTNLSCDIMYYNDYTLPLVLGDYDTLKGEKLEDTVTDGKFKAVKLELTLPRSTYATMAIREVLKSDTSANHHTSLNVV